MEPIKECSICTKIYCGKCLAPEFRCCGTKTFKNMNRIGKELALKQLRFKHTCRPSAELDQHVTDGLEIFFEIIDPSPDLMCILL